jgi:16S rRNA (guanine1207-N2)-methyltransferase
MDVVFTNPPIRAGRRVVRAFIDDAWRVLRPGGRFYLVARTAQGAKTLARLIDERFGAVREVALAHGYRVYEAVRTPDDPLAALHGEGRTEPAVPVPSAEEGTVRV